MFVGYLHVKKISKVCTPVCKKTVNSIHQRRDDMEARQIFFYHTQTHTNTFYRSMSLVLLCQHLAVAFGRVFFIGDFLYSLANIAFPLPRSLKWMSSMQWRRYSTDNLRRQSYFRQTKHNCNHSTLFNQ